MIEIDKKKDGERIRMEGAAAGKTLLELLQEHHIYIEAPCGGKGNCGRCRVKVVRGAAEPTGKERRLLTETELENGIRLACAVRPEGDCSIELCFEDGEEIASLSDGSGKTVSWDRKEKTAAGKREAAYGIAVDIGTTTLAAALVDLKNGDRRAAAASVNHQRAYGADVISRIQAANEGKGALLRECICADVKSLMEELVGQAGIPREQVQKLVIAANTTMCHLLRGLSCDGLGAAPFTPADLTLWEGTIQELLDTELWSGKAVILPGISAFVGADLVAGIYASDMDRQAEPCLLLDVGTNGEMVLGGREGFLVTSAAAGPVFEGGNISCGVPGIPGAVSHVTLQKRQAAETAAPGAEKGLGMAQEPGAEETAAIYTCSYETIANRPPVGLCGTGIIDVTSELVRMGLVDENGTLAEPWFKEGFAVAGDTVRFTQGDIREIQMGKSAIRAGIETLLLEYEKEPGRQPEKCSEPGQQPAEAARPDCAGIRIYLAGGFGCYMDVEKAIRIGLFPDSFSGRVKAVGNSALEGAMRFLLSEEKEAKSRVQWIASHAKEINLAMHPKFSDLYMEHMFFEVQE